MNRAMGTAEIDKSLETEVGRSLHELKRTAAVPHPVSAEHEMTADNLGALFRQMTKLSMSEVDGLIDELHRLRTKLEIDGDLIERAITQHSAHSEGVMQLTTIIADNVKKLPKPASFFVGSLRGSHSGRRSTRSLFCGNSEDPLKD